jgi:enoyl-CoA hydratase/carnithine racemase
MSSLVTYECRDGIGWLTLNRPEKLNAMNDQLILDFTAALDQLDNDATADVGLLHGAGRAFCSGADLNAAQTKQDTGSGMWSATLRPRDFFYKSLNWKPIVSAVHGYALGAGFGMAMRSDMFVVTRSAKMQITETARGVPSGSLWALLKFRGAGALADDLVFTSRFVTGEEAFKAGICNAVTDEDKLLETAEAYARQLQAMPADSLRSAIRVRRWYMEEAERLAGFLAEPRPILGMQRSAAANPTFTKADQLPGNSRGIAPA